MRTWGRGGVVGVRHPQHDLLLLDGGAFSGRLGDREDGHERDPELPAEPQHLRGLGALVSRSVAVLDTHDLGDLTRPTQRLGADVGQSDVVEQTFVVQGHERRHRGRDRPR